jgi:thiazole synthase
MNDALKIGKYELESRLIVGTGKYPSMEVMQAAHAASGTSMVTVAIRRINLDDRSGKTMLDYLDRSKYVILPNTAGCYSAKEAVLTAQLARELVETDLIKLEVIGDPQTLYPDTRETLAAAEQLVADGFTVLPYILDDPIACKQLEELGCAAVMPLAAPIGSGLGVCNPYSIRIIKERASVPVIVDAGVGHAYFDEAGVRDALASHFEVVLITEEDVDTIVGRWAHARRPTGSMHWFVRARRR